MIVTGYILLRFFHFSSLLFFSGTLGYMVLLTRGKFAGQLGALLKTPLWWSAAIALVSALGIFAAQTVLMSGQQNGFTQPDIWRAVAATHFGRAWGAEMLLPALTLLLIRFSGPRIRKLLLLSSMIQLLCLAGTGHAAMHDGIAGIAGQLSQTVHLLGAAFWCGGLYPLLRLMQQAGREYGEREALLSMMRFSRYGHWAVAVTLFSGVINTLSIAGFSLQPTLWLSLLMLKVLFVMLMVTIALYNRYTLVPQFKQAANDDSRQLFIRLTRLELITSLVVIGLVSLLATLSPG
ncbi:MULTISPECIES: copper homeostasis membrane protein CopD [Tatumella]|uniref:Copper resistance protein D n=1 Tax=Tatumella punctata TaxID=399969 RepID=A0ABW1VJ58_9GAMM|nr:copper homeostasis membrane protein CopD [Tatumella sp. JGM16]MBS0894061.1 copper homeostasis membrane protein CopD [Tatumella sp. JGM130]MBS0911624.1 copper homeostasis membrane protein CopD [Tatumella sp. JGM91]